MEKSLLEDEPMESTAYSFDDFEMQEDERWACVIKKRIDNISSNTRVES